jgi:hypothetical protein
VVDINPDTLRPRGLLQDEFQGVLRKHPQERLRDQSTATVRACESRELTQPLVRIGLAAGTRWGPWDTEKSCLEHIGIQQRTSQRQERLIRRGQ